MVRKSTPLLLREVLRPCLAAPPFLLIWCQVSLFGLRRHFVLFSAAFSSTDPYKSLLSSPALVVFVTLQSSSFAPVHLPAFFIFVSHTTAVQMIAALFLFASCSFFFSGQSPLFSSVAPFSAAFYVCHNFSTKAVCPLKEYFQSCFQAELLQEVLVQTERVFVLCSRASRWSEWRGGKNTRMKGL